MRRLLSAPMTMNSMTVKKMSTSPASHGQRRCDIAPGPHAKIMNVTGPVNSKELTDLNILSAHVLTVWSVRSMSISLAVLLRWRILFSEVTPGLMDGLSAPLPSLWTGG